MSVIKLSKEEALFGVRYWAQWFGEYAKPRYEVFVYVGRDLDRGLYLFQSKRNPKTIISKGRAQLNTNGFYPFRLCIANEWEWAGNGMAIHGLGARDVS